MTSTIHQPDASSASTAPASSPTVADVAVEGLLANGLDTLFVLPGVQNDHLFDAFHRRRDSLRLVMSRHEQGAAYMALGAAMASGKPAAYCVVPGPGMLNTGAALATAYGCNAPVLALTGQIPSAMIGRGLGFLHEIPDQLGILQRLTKWASRIDRPEAARATIDRAFFEMTSGRPRPVGVECALDVWPRPAGPQEDFRAPSEAQPDTAAIERAIALLERAKHPLIVVGSGAQDASSEITALAEKLGAPVLAHRMGHGVIDSRHRLSMNVVAGRDYWAVADVVLAIGTRLQFQQIQWGLDDAIKVIRIDSDPTEIDRWREPEVGIVADARAATRLILDNLGALAADEIRLDEIDRIKARAREAVAYLEPQNSLLRTIRDILPEDGIFVDELTQLGYVSRLTFPVYRPRTFLSPGYQGTLGWGLATGLGAKVACPQSDVLVVSGDGGFMFTVQELATAVQFRIPIVVLLVNDGGFGNVRRTQTEEFDGRTIASDLTNPDFVRLAESFGVRGIRVEAFEDLGPALKQAFASGEPTVVELRAGEMPSPWKFLRFGRVRPVSQV